MSNARRGNLWDKFRGARLLCHDEEVIRPPSKKGMKDQRLEQFELRVLAAQIQQSSKHLLKPPLVWRFPIKSPALMEVIG